MDRNIKKFKFKLSNFRTSLLFVSLLFVLLFSSTPCVLTAQGAEFNVVSVKDPDMLRSAVSTAAESGVPVVIVLENDITLTETALTISHNADVTLTSNNALVRENGVEFFRLIGVTDANTILVDDRGVLRLEGVIDVLGHIEGEKVITLEATCTAEGAWEISCIVCDELLESGIIPAHGRHNFVRVPSDYPAVIPDCDELLESGIIPAHGRHNFVRVPSDYPAVIPYCDEYWYYVDECVFCGVTCFTPFQPSYLDHYWGDGTVVVPATCTENGLMFFYCTKCGVFLGEGVIDVLGHNWDKGVITIPVTHETDGLMTFTCSHCGVTYTELIPKPSDNTLSVSGVEIEFEAVGGTVTLKPTQTQMTVILSIPGKDVIFDLRGHTFVELYVGAGWFKNVDKTIIIKTADGEATVNTKSLWNNSGKTILITVDNGKLNFKNI